jgi:hypothetical protein
MPYVFMIVSMTFGAFPYPLSGVLYKLLKKSTIIFSNSSVMRSFSSWVEWGLVAYHFRLEISSTGKRLGLSSFGDLPFC